jgi:hypothetical protein
MKSVPITTKVVSLNPTHGKVEMFEHVLLSFESKINLLRDQDLTFERKNMGM